MPCSAAPPPDISRSAAPPPDISRSAEREISGGGADVLRCDVPCDDVCDGSRILPRIDLVVGTKLRSDMSGGEVVCRYNKTLQYLWSFDEYLCTNPAWNSTEQRLDRDEKCPRHVRKCPLWPVRSRGGRFLAGIVDSTRVRVACLP